MPRRNLQHLMLREDVVEAVEQGRFYLWAVDTVDQGIEILTGVPAGEEQQGGYPADSIHGLVKARLRQLATGLAALRGDGSRAAAGESA